MSELYSLKRKVRPKMKAAGKVPKSVRTDVVWGLKLQKNGRTLIFG